MLYLTWLFVLSSQLVCVVSKFEPLFDRKEQPPAIDGSWSSWNSWTACYQNTPGNSSFFSPWLNFNLKSRKRFCNSPAPLYGGADCPSPSYRYQQCNCDNPLLLSTERINSAQITASSFLKSNPPSNIRFLSNNTGWCSESKLNYISTTFLMIDFGHFVKAKSIELIGNENGRVKKFKLEHSLDANIWDTIYTTKNTNEFTGNLLPNVVMRNNFKEDLILKYLKIVPMDFYYLPCLKMEVFGCIYTCGKFLTNPFGNIEAQSSVEFDQNCLWKIQVLNTTSLTFVFKVFYLLCENGFLEFYDGEKPLQPSSSIYRICLKDLYEDIPQIKLNYNKIWVHFVSNSSSSEDSFNIDYFSECNQEIYLNIGEPYKVESPNFPNDYLDNLNCEWHLYVPKPVNETVIIFESFGVESSKDGSCSYDLLTLNVVENGVETSLGSFCNNNKPKTPFKVKAQKLHIVFRTDVITSDKGFSILVKAGEKDVKTTPILFSSNRKTFVSNIITSPSGVDVNNSFPGIKKLHTSKGGDEWTVIIISAFSALLIFLCIFVIGHSIHRYIKRRNEMYTHCAKLMAQTEKNDKKEKENQNEEKKLLHKTSPTKHKVKMLKQPCESIVENDENTFVTEIIQEHNGLEGSCISPTGVDQLSQLPIQVNVQIVNSNMVDLEESRV